MNITNPPASISYAVAANGSAGIVARADTSDPLAHMTADATQSPMPHNFAPPDGCASTPTPTNPSTTPNSAGNPSRSRPASRNSTIHNGTDAMISDASPVGTLRSAKNRTAFAPGSRQPISTQASAARRETRSVPPLASTMTAMIVPEVMKRVDAAKSGGIVRPA